MSGIQLSSVSDLQTAPLPHVAELVPADTAQQSQAHLHSCTELMPVLLWLNLSAADWL